MGIQPLNLPSELTLHAPLSLSQTRFRRQQDGKTSLRGTLQVQDGPLVSADIHWDEQELRVQTVRHPGRGFQGFLYSPAPGQAP